MFRKRSLLLLNNVCIRKTSYSRCISFCSSSFMNVDPRHEVAQDPFKNSRQHRNFSFQSTIENVIKTQAGIFKTLSESAPVECAQTFLVNSHQLTGLPWWTNIIFCTVVLRTTITLPFAVYQNYILSKVENLKHEMPPIVEELKRETALAVKMFKWDERTAKYYYMRSVKKQWNNLIVKHNCHPFKAALVLWVQIPMWISLSIAFRNLVYMLPHLDMEAQSIYCALATEGIGWISNLTVPDVFVLPLVLGITNLLIIEIQVMSRKSVPTRTSKILTNIFRGLTVIMIPIAASVPSCIVVYWTTSSVYGLVQNLCLMSPKIRRMCKIPKTQAESEQPYSHIFTEFKRKYGSMTKSGLMR